MADSLFSPDKSEIKYMILYAMDLLRQSASESDVYDICSFATAINYFDFSEAFHELADSGHIEFTGSVEGAECFCISSKGSDAADTFLLDIKPSVRKKIQLSLLRVSKSINRASSIQTSSIANGDGTYSVTLSLLDKSSVVFSITLLAGDENQAHLLENHFKQNAESIYKTILADLFIIS